jgi:hypothetical protein
MSEKLPHEDGDVASNEIFDRTLEEVSQFCGSLILQEEEKMKFCGEIMMLPFV